MLFAFYFLVANVTKFGFACGAVHHVAQTFFNHYVFALFSWTHHSKLDIHPLDILVAFCNYFWSDLVWKQCAFVGPMIWLLFIVLLSFGWRTTCPTEVTKTFCALNLRTTARIFCYWHTTFSVRAWLGTMFKKQFAKKFFRNCVFLNHCRKSFVFFEFFRNVKAVNFTSFIWMNSLSTVQAKVKITKRAFSRILKSVNVCKLWALWQRTPSHIVHLSNCVSYWQVFIYLFKFGIQF